MKILIIDPACPKPYSLNSFDGCGGTEHTVVKIAEGLQIPVEQHNRTEDADLYKRFGSTPEATHVIVLRSPIAAANAKARFPRAKVYLWTHDLPGPRLGASIESLIKLNIEVLCVSNWHKQQTVEVLRAYGYTGQFKVNVIYNPIDDDLAPNKEPYNKNKLVWTSSPHKGLSHALNIFRNLQTFNPDFTLTITNPGYLPNHGSDIRGVNIVGSIPHVDVIGHVRTSLALFYPNTVFPETFGLVMAEANAVGTPVLTHRLGAASEILDSPAEIVDCKDFKKVITRIMSWYENGRPTVRGKPEFRLSRVLRAWKEILK